MNMISATIRNRTGIITMNRPQKRNALHPELITELKEVLNSWKKNEEVKIILLQAAGTAFSSGADLAYLQELSNYSFKENYQDSIHLKELFDCIYRHPKVIIARIQGHAIAGGCGLAAVCDYTIAAAEAKFGYTEVRIGFLPALVSVYLRRKIGEAHARGLLLRGHLISANEAYRLGLINEVVSTADLDHVIEERLSEFLEKNSATSMRMVKEMMTHIPEYTYEEALEYAAEMNAKARETEDCRKGLTAFLNKEQIIW